MAVSSGNAEMTNYMLSTSSLTLTHHGDFLKELVVSAIYSSSLSVIKCLVDKYPDLLQGEYQMTYQCRYKHGISESCSLLHHAAVAGSKEIMEFLVQSGLDVKQRTSEREHTVLGFAAGSAHTNVVDYILNTNSSEDILSLGADPMVMAGAGGSVEIFSNLVNVGFNPMQIGKRGMTALHIALRTGKEELALYVMKQYPASILMSEGQYGRSALHFAAEGGSVTLLKHLIDMGLDARYVDATGETILDIACLCGQKNAVVYMTHYHKYLLQNKDTHNRTALHTASQGGNIYIFKHLIACGLNVYDLDTFMANMLHRACCQRNHEMIAYLLQHYRDDMVQPTIDGWYPFHAASQFGDETTLRLFIDNNVDICKFTSREESILHISCRYANIDTTRFILEQFPQLIPLKNIYDVTALELAVDAGAADIVKLFRKK